MNYPRTSLTPDSGWKSNICKRLPAYVSLHNFSLTSASPKCTSDYLSLFGNESLIQTSTPHLCDRIPHYNQRRTSGSTKKISQFHLPFRVRSHTIGTPITSARRTPPHSSCNDRSSLLTHTFCRSESLSEISCLDQESPITNQILAWSASHHLDKVKPKCLACSSIHSSSVSPSEISDHTCIESYDDLLSSGTFNMYQTPSNSDMTESHDQLMSPDQHLEPLSGCALQLKPFTSKTSSSNLLNVTQGNATSSSSISSSPNDRSSSIKNSANMEQIISIGSNHSNQSENEDEAGVTSSSSESLDVLHNQRIMIRSLLRFAVQVFIPLSICGFGNMAAGLLLDRVQQLRVFDVLSELYIAIPCLMGLKGNLEMTMASRLSTAVSSSNLIDQYWSQILILFYIFIKG